MVHGMIGALWEATTMRQLYAASGATFAYVSYILMSYRADMKSATAFMENDSKVPRLMQRASIQEWMKKEEVRTGAA